MESEKDEMYDKLKQNILDSIGSIDSKNIKHIFKWLIESERSYQNIKTVNDLFEILEDRDIINDDNLCAVQKILTSLLDNKQVKSINDEKLHIEFYKKQYTPIEKCKKCKKENSIEEPKEESFHYVPPTPTAPPLNNFMNYTAIPTEINEYKDISKIDQVIQEISKRIGKDWRCLPPLIKIRECDATNIIKKFGNGHEQAALEALTLWRSQNKRKSENEMIRILVEALRCDSFFQHGDLADEIEEDYLIS